MDLANDVVDKVVLVFLVTRSCKDGFVSYVLVLTLSVVKCRLWSSGEVSYIRNV